MIRGLFAFLGILFLSFSFFKTSAFAQQQPAAKPYPYKVQVTGDEPYMYDKPDFDAKVVQTLQPGKIYNVSPQLQGGAFYRISGEGGVLGYISDADVRPLWKGAPTGEGKKEDKTEAKKKAAEPPPTPKKKPEQKAEELKRPKKDNRPFEYTQYVGIQYNQIEFTENTMGDRRKEALGFFGAKLSGPDLVIEGEIPTEVNFLFHSGAPGYYEKMTGKGADGWILLMNFLLESYFPQGKNALTFLGFGPELRYSKFTAALTDSTTGKTSSYSMEDIGIGAVFNMGAAVRLGRTSLRGDIQYHWEKESYLGAGLTLQMAF